MINISIVGGDNRNLILSQLLKKDGFNVLNKALGTTDENDLSTCINTSKYIVTAIPFSTDFENIHTPLSKDKIKISYFFELLKDKVLIGGKFSNDQKDKLKKCGNTVIDLMDNEDLAKKNAIPTVEGIVKIIIENTKVTINNSNIAIVGFGRIGKRAALILQSMGAKIFCMDTNKEEVANISLYGYNVIEKIDENNSFDVIVNTVPKLVIAEKELKNISKTTLIVDVSSKPGGIDFNFAKQNGYKVIHELGIPGKIAPITAAKYIEEIIKKLVV